MLVILTFPSDVVSRAGGEGLLVEALDAEQDPRNPAFLAYRARILGSTPLSTWFR